MHAMVLSPTLAHKEEETTAKACPGCELGVSTQRAGDVLRQHSCNPVRSGKGVSRVRSNIQSTRVCCHSCNKFRSAFSRSRRLLPSFSF